MCVSEACYLLVVDVGVSLCLEVDIGPSFSFVGVEIDVHKIHRAFGVCVFAQRQKHEWCVLFENAC